MVQGSLGTYFEMVLGEADPALFSRKFIKALLDEQLRGYNNAKRLFALTMFELWRRHYKVNVPGH